MASENDVNKEHVLSRKIAIKSGDEEEVRRETDFSEISSILRKQLLDLANIAGTNIKYINVKANNQYIKEMTADIMKSIDDLIKEIKEPRVAISGEYDEKENCYKIFLSEGAVARASKEFINDRYRDEVNLLSTTDKNKQLAHLFGYIIFNELLK